MNANTMRKLCFPLLLAAVSSAYAQRAVVVVHDRTAVTNQIANIAKYTQQIDLLKSQMLELQKTYAALNGLRDIGGLMKDKLLAQTLPPDLQAAVRALQSGKGGSLSGISGALNEIAAGNQARSCAQTYSDPAAIASCNQAWQTMAMDKYVGQSGYEQASKNIADMEEWVRELKNSPDAKSTADFTARVGLQQLKQNEEAMKLRTVAMMAAADKQMQQARNADCTQQALLAPLSMRWGANASKP